MNLSAIDKTATGILLTLETSSQQTIFATIHSDYSGISINPPYFRNVTDLGELQQALLANRNFILEESKIDVFKLVPTD